MQSRLCCVSVLLLCFCAIARSQSEPEASDVDDFYRSRFGNGDTSRMRVILGDTEGWVNPHDMLGTASEARSKRAQQQPQQQHHQSKLKKSSGAPPSEPISEDTTSPETRARIYSEIRARSAAESRKFSRYPAETERDETDASIVDGETATEDEVPAPSCGNQRCDCDCKALRRESKKCAEQVKQLRLSQVLVDGAHDREFIYLRRLALNVIYSAKFGSDEMPSNVKFEILLSSDDVATLEKLATNAGTKSSQLEQKLSTILSSSVVTPDELPHGANALLGRLAQAWGHTMGPVDVRFAVPLCGVLGVVVIAFIWGRAWKVIIVMSAFYFLVLSFVWHWALCYQVEHARRDAYISRNEVPPEHCRPGYTPSWMQWALGRENSAECDKYYESLHIDPVWQVNPLFVLTELLSKALFNPLANMGTALGQFARNFAEHQTWWSMLNNVVNVICVCVLGLFAAMVFGKLFLFFLTTFYWNTPRRPQHERVEEVPASELTHSFAPRPKIRPPRQEQLCEHHEEIAEDEVSCEEDEVVEDTEESNKIAGGDMWQKTENVKVPEKT
ncbi:uncharacterized protein LOC144100963 [Amblyomma americanum]